MERKKPQQRAPRKKRDKKMSELERAIEQRDRAIEQRKKALQHAQAVDANFVALAAQKRELEEALRRAEERRPPAPPQPATAFSNSKPQPQQQQHRRPEDDALIQKLTLELARLKQGSVSLEEYNHAVNHWKRAYEQIQFSVSSFSEEVNNVRASLGLLSKRCDAILCIEQAPEQPPQPSTPNDGEEPIFTTNWAAGSGCGGPPRKKRRTAKDAADFFQPKFVSPFS
jgi:hypothetical protein